MEFIQQVIKEGVVLRLKREREVSRSHILVRARKVSSWEKDLVENRIAGFSSSLATRLKLAGSQISDHFFIFESLASLNI